MFDIYIFGLNDLGQIILLLKHLY